MDICNSELVKKCVYKNLILCSDEYFLNVFYDLKVPEPDGHYSE